MSNYNSMSNRLLAMLKRVDALQLELDAANIDINQFCNCEKCRNTDTNIDKEIAKDKFRRIYAERKLLIDKITGIEALLG